MKIQKRENFSAGGKTRKDNKGNIALYAGIITYIISLAMRIPLSGVIGDTGIALFAPAYELFILCTLLFSYGISRTMSGLIRYRMKRAQYRSARKVFQMALKISLVISVLLAFVMVFASGYLSEVVALESMSRKAIMAVAPLLIVTALVNVFRGYFNGNGFGILVAHSQYIEKIAMVITAIAGGRIAYEYGLKVEALVKNNTVAYAYGALGVVLGIMASQLITLLYLIFVFAAYAGTWKRQLSQDNGRRTESDGEIIKMLLGNSIPVALAAVLFNVFMLIDQRFFNYCMNRKELAGTRAALWGSYYGKFAVFAGIGAALVCLAIHGGVTKAITAYEKEEYHVMREKIAAAVKSLCVTAFPIAIYLAVLADAFIGGFYKGENPQAAGLLKQGTVIIFLYGASYLFGQLLLKTHMAKELFISLAAALAVHLGALFLLVRKSLMGAEGVLYSVILFTLVMAVSFFLFAARKLKYRQEWLYSFAFPAVSAAVSGLVVMLLGKALLDILGNIATILISCLVGLILYILLLMVLRVLNEAELGDMPLGRVWIAIGRMIGVL
ncbi:MAG: polysaccharide biosynthesis C-terminal domain-containing protein [Bacillus sp. (in: Bacteria)]|nr:polysaccharide biosynthesis C-terminal domain-containing protein [Bacillus sp. (in: firmicutes)]MCM1426809.1 polysaccharide biosynthesis C-terminal domain-containing protein [Eubacterium sp.]